MWYRPREGDTVHRGLEVRLDTVGPAVSQRSVPSAGTHVSDEYGGPFEAPTFWYGVDRVLGEWQGVPVVARVVSPSTWRVVAAGTGGDTVIREVSGAEASFRLEKGYLITGYRQLGTSEYFVDIIPLSSGGS